MHDPYAREDDPTEYYRAPKKCNYCKLRQYRVTAKARGHKILLRPDDGWMVVYELPEWAQLPDDKDKREAFFVASMWEIGASCSC